MSRTLTTGQQATPDHLEWLAQIGSLHGATTPGIVVAGQVYDLEIAHISETNSLTMLAQGATPTAAMSVFGATPQPGDTITLWSLHGDLTEPLMQFKGRVEQVREVAGGWAEIACSQDAVVTEIPRAHINGNATHVVIGEAEIGADIYQDTATIDNPATWGVDGVDVSDDAVDGTVVTLTGIALTDISQTGSQVLQDSGIGTQYNAPTWASPFTVSVTTDFASVSMVLSTIANAWGLATCAFNIRADAGGLPNTVVMYSTPLITIGSVDSPQKYTIPFSSPARLVPGSYWVAVQAGQYSPTLGVYGDITLPAGAKSLLSGVFWNGATTWSGTNFGLLYDISPVSNSVSVATDGAHDGNMSWLADIAVAAGDIVIPRNQQLSIPAPGETVTITTRNHRLYMIGSYWGANTTVVNAVRADSNGQTRNMPMLTSDIATSASGTLGTTGGMSFTVAIETTAAAVVLTTTSDRSALSDRYLYLREGASFAAGAQVGSAKVYAARLTNARVVTIAFDAPAVLHPGETYWLGVSQDAIYYSGLAVKSFDGTSASATIDGVSVGTFRPNYLIKPIGLVAQTRNGSSAVVADPNSIRQWLLSLTSTLTDSTSYAALTSRYASDGLVLGGLLQANTVSQALAEIDRHTRTLSTIVGDTHYLIDGDATASANIAADEALQVNRASSSYGAVMTRVAYSYKQGSGSGTVIDSVREGVYPLRSASLSLNLLPDATNAAATAAWRLSLLGINRRVAPILIADMATTAGDVVAVAGQLLRVDRISMGAAQIIEAEAVEI